MSIYFWFQFALLIAFLFISAPRGGMFLGLFLRHRFDCDYVRSETLVRSSSG